MSKILLVEPPMPRYGSVDPPRYPPLALATIVSHLEGHEVQLFDCAARGVDVSAAAEHARAGGYDVVGARAVFITYPQAVRLAAELGRVGYSGRVVFGGPHLSLVPEDCFDDCPEVDACVLGEGEVTFPAYLDRVHDEEDSETKPAIPDAGCPVLVSRTGPPLSAEWTDLDAGPLPRRDLYLSFPYYREARFTTIEGARGCDRDCIFCALPRTQGRRIRRKSITRVMAELAQIRAEGYGAVEFLEPHFTSDSNWAEELSRALIDQRLGLAVVIRTYPEFVEPELLKLLARAGVMRIFFGIESGCERVLSGYGRRGATVARSADALAWTRAAGIQAYVNILVGGPGEDESSIEDSVRFIRDTNPDFADVSLIAPFPRTPLYDRASEFGLSVTAPQWYRDEATVARFPWVSALATQAMSAEQLLKAWVYAATRITRRLEPGT